MADPFHLFIDTNVFLSFYAFTNDDLEELRKIVALIDKGQLHVYLPRAVVDEFRRNRETKLAESLKTLDVAVTRSMPRFAEAYPEATDFREALSKAETLRKKLLELARHDAAVQKLAADKLINEIIGSAGIIDMSNEVLAAAKDRMTLENPPGKKGTLGDRLNWETLLRADPQSC